MMPYGFGMGVRPLPTMGEEQPIISTVPITSTAPGDEAIAGAAGAISTTAFNVATNMNNAASKASLLGAITESGNARTQAMLAIQKNPDPEAVNQTVQNYQQQTSNIVGSTPLNNADRAVLGRMAGRDMNRVTLAAGQNNLYQAQVQSGIAFNTMLHGDGTTANPGLLTQIQQNLLSDPDTANAQMDTVRTNAQNAYRSGAITQANYNNVMSTLGALTQRHTALLQMAGQGGTAAQYHATTTMPGTQPDPTAPVNETTRLFNVSLNQDTNYQDAVAGLHNGQLNAQAVYTMPQQQFQKFMLTYQGVAAAKGAINSNEAYPVMQARYNFLNKSNPQTLTIAEQGERDQLSAWMNKLNNNYIGAMSDTAAGQAISKGFNQQAAAIDNSPINDTAKAQQNSQAYNDYITKMVNLGKSMHVPDNLIRPIPTQKVANAQSAFALNGDPNAALSTMSETNDQNGTYLAASMSTPVQQEVMQTANLLQGTKSSALSPILIQANQTGRDYSALKLGSDGVSNAQINATLATALAPTLNYLSQQPNGGQRASAMLQMSANAVKYMAVQNGDFAVNNLKNYVKTVQDSLGSAYNIQSGTGYAFNTTEMGNISNSDAAALSTYVRNQAYGSMGDVSQSQLSAAQDRNPLMVTYTPGGNIIAKDSQGSIVWSRPYTSTLLSAAKHSSVAATAANQSNAFNFVTGPGQGAMGLGALP